MCEMSNGRKKPENVIIEKNVQRADKGAIEEAHMTGRQKMVTLNTSCKLKNVISVE